MICLNHSVLDFMEARIEGKRVLEFGGGYSSLWFAERCAELITVETSPRWAEFIEMRLRGHDHAFVFLVNHVTEIRTEEPFDLVLVDCEKLQRHEAATLGWRHLREGGWLVFDDAQREQHRTTCSQFGKPDHVLKWDPDRDIRQAKHRVALAWRKR